jgi:hopanoid-associated phosphorylase
MMTKKLLVACGFNREADIIKGPDVITVAGGGVAANLEKSLESQAVNASAIVSFGLTGALVDGLVPGDWIIGDRLTGAETTDTHEGWRNAAAKLLPEARLGAFFADGNLISSVEHKRSLGIEHGAIAVDMESHVAARVARKHGLPFMVLRVVSDGVEHMLPPAICVSMRPDGGIHYAAMMKSLATNPGQLPQFISTVKGATAGFKALLRGYRVLGSRLALPDLV